MITTIIPAASMKLSYINLQIGSIYMFTYYGATGAGYIGLVVTGRGKDGECFRKLMLVLRVIGSSSDTVGEVFEIPYVSSGTHELFEGSITLSNG